MKELQEFLSEKIVDSKHERKITSSSLNDSQGELENRKKDFEVIKSGQKDMRRNDIDWEEKFNIMEQEMREIKKQWKDMIIKKNTY